MQRGREKVVSSLNTIHETTEETAEELSEETAEELSKEQIRDIVDGQHNTILYNSNSNNAGGNDDEDGNINNIIGDNSYNSSSSRNTTTISNSSTTLTITDDNSKLAMLRVLDNILDRTAETKNIDVRGVLFTDKMLMFIDMIVELTDMIDGNSTNETSKLVKSIVYKFKREIELQHKYWQDQLG